MYIYIYINFYIRLPTFENDLLLILSTQRENKYYVPYMQIRKDLRKACVDDIELKYKTL